VQIISSVRSPQPYLLSSAAPFITVRCRRPPSSLRRRLARRERCARLHAARRHRCALLLLPPCATRCGPPPLLHAAARCWTMLLLAAAAAPAHTAARKKLPFNISILIFSIFYVSNFNILFSQFQHFERQMLNIFNRMLI